MPIPVTEFDYEAAVTGCAAGNHEALHRLYEQEGARLLGVAHRLVRDMALAEDVVHDAFVNIWTHAGTFNVTKGAARGWMYSITRHLAFNSIRKHRREIEVDESTKVAIDARESLEAWHDITDAFVWKSSAGRIGPCLERLEPVRRNCILHAYVDGLSHSEIASRVGAPLGTVKAWIKRSLQALKECLA
ncbi:sigma-70 family RNA polymerase sigma factor [Burkholderia sp. PAMC 26561]|uniref:sigma-70 family RNA polymerase sigma factor n=1 Tax=Burkholderia sp. PAMC 26561 TaxID=1795043 RepID=UPI00076B600D|nr:sigma-70 family RNA polymerase sigma factor [Burkholderia sp. PAMC 26561]AME26870.1 RNA polymerase subunit sigma [Burkholderia sp. PAMC 26561]AME27985.1 RNA polymerase subunit sigma [Burkholderia sp. PAMC 26561]